MNYVSNTGGGGRVDFETAILDGFAKDGGLYVPEILPKVSLDTLENWANLSYTELAFEVLSLYIDRSIISAADLRKIIEKAYRDFEIQEIIPLYSLKSRKDTHIMELFHGPTLSFKDIGMAFLVTLVDFFLERKNEFRTLLVATTGDTGPAAAFFAAGKPTLEAWVLYPENRITVEQVRQMTTLLHHNIHAVGVADCPEGGDDLDVVIAKLYSDKTFKEELQISSVNSVNWGRVLMQMVHYFYGYFQVADTVGEEINISVPSGGFGNLCAGSIARMMGLPIHTYVSASNKNDSLHRIFSRGVLSKADMYPTTSSAIDILTPYNFWRYLYVVTKDAEKIKGWKREFEEKDYLEFDPQTYALFSNGFRSESVSDSETIALIKDIFEAEGYLLDPHAAVSLRAADKLKPVLEGKKLICLATAHPAKFPDTIIKALGSNGDLPEAAKHHSIERAKTECEKVYLCHLDYLEHALKNAMKKNRALKKESLARMPGSSSLK